MTGHQLFEAFPSSIAASVRYKSTYRKNIALSSSCLKNGVSKKEVNKTLNLESNNKLYFGFCFCFATSYLLFRVNRNCIARLRTEACERREWSERDRGLWKIAFPRRRCRCRSWQAKKQKRERESEREIEMKRELNVYLRSWDFNWIYHHRSDKKLISYSCIYSSSLKKYIYLILPLHPLQPSRR